MEGDVFGEAARPADLADDAGKVAGQHRHLLLLDLQGELVGPLSALEQEDALADRADRADREVVGGVEVVLGHDGTSSVSEPVELTQRTNGPPGPITMADTEHGEITMRWNMSRGTPAADGQDRP